jgi:hypothetical protein
MQLFFLVDIAAFSADRKTTLNRCLLAVGRLLRSAAKTDPATRFSYQLVDSRCQPEALVTRYLAVAGDIETEFPAMGKGEEL